MIDACRCRDDVDPEKARDLSGSAGRAVKVGSGVTVLESLEKLYLKTKMR